MFGRRYRDDEIEPEWRGGVYLTTAKNSIEAEILESKLRSEEIPCLKKYRGASNAVEIIMGSNSAYAIDLYVPEQALEDAKNIIVAVPIDENEFDGEEFELEEVEDQSEEESK